MAKPALIYTFSPAPAIGRPAAIIPLRTSSCPSARACPEDRSTTGMQPLNTTLVTPSGHTSQRTAMVISFGSGLTGYLARATTPSRASWRC